MVSSNFDTILLRQAARNRRAKKYDWLHAWERPFARLWERMVVGVADKKAQMTLIRIIGGVVMLAIVGHFINSMLNRPPDPLLNDIVKMGITALITLLVSNNGGVPGTRTVDALPLAREGGAAQERNTEKP